MMENFMLNSVYTSYGRFYYDNYVKIAHWL